MRPNRCRAALAALASLVLTLPSLTAQALDDGKWLGTWSTSPVRMDDAAAARMPFGREEVTLREVVHISQGGKQVRLVLTNEFGDTPLTVAGAHMGFLASGSRILAGTDRALTFGGQAGVTIAPGATAASDPVSVTLPIFSDLVFSLRLPAQELRGITFHPEGLTTSFVEPGDHLADAELLSPESPAPGLSRPDVTAPVQSPASLPPSSKPIVSPAPENREQTATNGQTPVTKFSFWFFLKDVEVDRARGAGALICFGDSITDGTKSTPETNRRYPDLLAPLLAANKHTRRMAVLNQGIAGNRVLHEGFGPSAGDRFDRDALNQPGAKAIVLLEGINDIGLTDLGRDPVTVDQLTAAYTSLARRAHSRGLRIYAGTILPFLGAGYASPAGETMRQAVNQFLRTSRDFDGVVDFEKAVEDPKNPGHMLPKYDSGDHLHPGDVGYERMAEAFDLKALGKH